MPTPRDVIFPDANFSITRTGPGGPIRHMAVPSFPELKFEWHPETKKVYQLYKQGVTFVLGEEVAGGIGTLREFELVAGWWVAGYGAARRRLVPNKEK